MTTLATMPAIASTGPMLLLIRKSTLALAESDPRTELQIAGARGKFLAPVTLPLAQSTAFIEPVR
jgi:hypothetical protein